ncbi:MAG: MBL fold metallo-hydrolase [Rhodospirillales bacterium]|nr:MBL fold metallo-hydrolase [Rhodospirillales bacterium]
MLFRQLFDSVSSTYTYLIASRMGGEALIIDPVYENVDHYQRLIRELDLKLVKAVDTHCHADHITGLGLLRDRTRCITVMGRKTQVDVVSMRVDEGDTIDIETISLRVLYTPGHTDDSYCFHMNDRIFTGDTLLIRGTGRTDFQNGDPRQAYDSLFNKVLKLADETAVYPAHDYKGEMVSTIGEEKAFNPRLQVSSADEYAELMNNLHLPNPQMMDVAVPANLGIGFHAEDPDIIAATLSADQARSKLDDDNYLFVDLRETGERRRDGIIAGSVHAPYPSIDVAIAPGGLLHAMATQTRKTLLLYCAYGERSALALKAVREAGLSNACHLGGGIDAWTKIKAPLEFPA